MTQGMTQDIRYRRSHPGESSHQTHDTSTMASRTTAGFVLAQTYNGCRLRALSLNATCASLNVPGLQSPPQSSPLASTTSLLTNEASQTACACVVCPHSRIPTGRSEDPGHDMRRSSITPSFPAAVQIPHVLTTAKCSELIRSEMGVVLAGRRWHDDGHAC